MSVTRVLVANRGEIAVRIIRACQSLGIETVAAVSETGPRESRSKDGQPRGLHRPPRSVDSYLKTGTLVAAAQSTGCDALHPGYGFLSERAELAQACVDNKITFIGPSAENITNMGDKLEARKIAASCGVSTLPGSSRQESARSRRAGRKNRLSGAAQGLRWRRWPGIKLVWNPSEMPTTFSTAAAEARAAFGNDTLYMERYIGNARHIEVQVLGDRSGNVIHLGERDCSLQRRHQKIIEEAPAYAVSKRCAIKSATPQPPWREASAIKMPAQWSLSLTTTPTSFSFLR